MNWTQLLSEISATGATQKEAADFCGCSQSTISELSRGEIKEPAHSLGESLIEFHKIRSRRSTDKKSP
jgi:predicted XRE-type DNA-binding protein